MHYNNSLENNGQSNGAGGGLMNPYKTLLLQNSHSP